MSVYLVNGKGWRYDFILQGKRFSGAWFTTKKEARQAESRKREEGEVGPGPYERVESPTDIDFLELVNRRLDHIEAYKSGNYYEEHVYLARRWVKEWKGLQCGEITNEMVESFLRRLARRVSPTTANKHLRYLRAAFNLGVKKRWITENPTLGTDFFPEERRIKYVPPKEDIHKVIEVAEGETRDYLVVITDGMARVSEINRLTWDDLNLSERYIVLYTRKKKGGHLTPRKVPMTQRLFEVLSRRYAERDGKKPWVFWHRYRSQKTESWIEGPYRVRSKIMTTLCKKAGVRYFRYHALRHFGASTLENAGVNISSIQRILGHENRTTTEIYLHSIGDPERVAMDVYERVTGAKSHTSPTQTARREKEIAVSP
jgi:integrase